MEILCAIPVYNEEAQLSASIHTLIDWVAGQSGNCWKPVIVDNGSTDNTWEISQHLAQRFNNIQAVHIPSKGRGGALRHVWSISNADILAYMDVDLSTDLDCLPRLIALLAANQADLAVGSRLHRRSTVLRGLRRTIISRCYNLLIKAAFRTRFSDAQCGFKAITKSAARLLLPLVEDDGWFFDTELLVLAEFLGCRIADLPVRWEDDPDSRVRILRTAIDDIRGIVRVRRNLRSGKYEATAAQRASMQTECAATIIPPHLRS